MRHQGIMRVYREKGSDLAVGWSKLWLSRGKTEPVRLLRTRRVFCDWIGGFCPADSLMIWFPAHWAPQVIKELERREQGHRKRFPQWFEDWVPIKYWQQQQDACASRTLQFQKRPYLESPIQLLTASIRVDWFSLPVQCFLDRMPQLRQGLIRRVFQTKASSPWGGNKSERIQVSMCLPNNRDLDTWYDAVYALPIAWPDVTDIGAHYFKKTSANQLLALRTQLGVSHMWGEISPQWHLLHHHLWNRGLNYLNAERLEELLILNRPITKTSRTMYYPIPTSRNGGSGNVLKMSFKMLCCRISEFCG